MMRWIFVVGVAGAVLGAEARAQEAHEAPVMGPPVPRRVEPLGPPVPERLVRPRAVAPSPRAVAPSPDAHAEGADAKSQAAAPPFSLGETLNDEAATREAGNPRVDMGLVEFLAARFSAHEPIYFLWGPLEPNSKFQISLKYQVLSSEGSLARQYPWVSNFYVAYSQTSFWDVGGESSPFFDSSYRPEVLYQQEWFDPQVFGGAISRLGVQAGLQHESNGRGGDSSRSLNIAYVRPIVTFGDPGTSGSKEFFVTVAPRLFTYISDVDDNENIADYRGYGDVRLIAGWRGSLQAAVTARVGNDWDKGSLQLDLTYPFRNWSRNNLDVYLHGQLFTGYGESLLGYDESDTTFRMGLSVVR